MNITFLSLALAFGLTVKEIDFKPFLEKDKELIDMYKASKILKNIKGKIILDNKTLYPLVVFYGNVNNIVFPYQFDFTYYYLSLWK